MLIQTDDVLLNELQENLKGIEGLKVIYPCEDGSLAITGTKNGEEEALIVGENQMAKYLLLAIQYFTRKFGKPV